MKRLRSILATVGAVVGMCALIGVVILGSYWWMSAGYAEHIYHSGGYMIVTKDYQRIIRVFPEAALLSKNEEKQLESTLKDSLEIPYIKLTQEAEGQIGDVRYKVIVESGGTPEQALLWQQTTARFGLGYSGGAEKWLQYQINEFDHRHNAKLDQQMDQFYNWLDDDQQAKFDQSLRPYFEQLVRDKGAHIKKILFF